MKLSSVLLAFILLIALAPVYGLEVEYTLLDYWHPLKGESTYGRFECADVVHMTDDENFQFDVFCDFASGDCSPPPPNQNLWYQVESGENVYGTYSDSGAAHFNWVKVDRQNPLLRARICSKINCEGGDVGPWCELDNRVWSIPSQLCEYLAYRLYIDCLLVVNDVSGKDLNILEAEAYCDRETEEWECLVDCMVDFDTCPGYNYCIGLCFPIDTDDDDSGDDDDTSDDDDTDDDDSGDDDNNDDTGDDDDTSGRQLEDGEDSSCGCGF